MHGNDAPVCALGARPKARGGREADAAVNWPMEAEEWADRGAEFASGQPSAGILVHTNSHRPARSVQHVFYARELSSVLEESPQTGVERIKLTLGPPRNSHAFVDPERDKQYPKGDHYDPERRYQQDDWQQACGDEKWKPER